MIEKLAIVKKAAAAKRLLVVPALLGAGLLATGLVSLLAVSLIGYEQTHGAAATDRSKADAVVDADGNLRVPANYRSTYQFLGPGRWRLARARVHRSSTSSTRRPARSLRIARMGIFPTARCS